jgi:hypothetical protein
MLGRRGLRIELPFNTRVAIAATLFLSGCALTPDQGELERHAANKIIRTLGDDCDVKWRRAITWVSQNSQWKIQTQNDNLIQTHPPINRSAASGFLVNKVPLGHKIYEISMTSGCDNLLGCIPNATGLKASFNRFVLSAEGPSSNSGSPGTRELLRPSPQHDLDSRA